MGENQAIVYKSKYSQVCEELGLPKPDTQGLENYCYLYELDWPREAQSILDKMRADVNSIKNMYPNDL
jgi:hypothetical protein